MAKKPPVTSANSRQERIKNRGKAPKSTPKGRQTTAMQRPFKPGTKTSNTTTKFAGQKALPAAGQSGGSKPPKGTTTPQRGGPTPTAAQAAQLRRSAAAARAAGAAIGQRAMGVATKLGRGAAKAGNIRSAIVGAVAERTLGPLAEKAGTALGKGPLTTLGRAIDDRLPGINSKDEARRKAAAAKPKAGLPALKGSMVNGKIQMTQVAKPKAKPAAKPKPVAPKAATTPTRSSAPSRSSAPGRSTTSARTTASRPAAKPAAKPTASANKSNYQSMYSSVKNFSGGGSSTDPTKSYGTRVNSSFSAESPSSMTKRQSLKDQTASIKKMIEESKKRQGKG